MIQKDPNQTNSNKAMLVAKWRKMLEHKKMAPLPNKKKPIVAAILENLLKRSKGLLKEDKLTTSDVQNFDTVLIPMIRRIAPELIALDILGTQVMEKPSQLIFALRAFPSGRSNECCGGGSDGFGYAIPGGRKYKEGDRANSEKKAQILIVPKIDNDESGFFGNDKTVNGSLKWLVEEGHIKKGYFLGEYEPGQSQELVIYGRACNISETEDDTSTSGKDYIVTDLADKMAKGVIYYVEETPRSWKIIVGIDREETSGSADVALGADFSKWSLIATDYDKLANLHNNEPISTEQLDGLYQPDNCFENEIMYNVVFNDYSGKYDTAEMEAFKTWNEVHFDIESTMVKAQGRLLKARYSLEVAEDLMAYHNLDAEEELVNMISYEVLAEMNREVVERIYKAAISNGNGVYNWNYGDQTSGADGRWSAEKYHSLYTLMNKIAGDIAIANRRGPANFAICSLATKVALESVSGYSLWTDVNNNFNAAAGIVYAGMLAGKYKIFVDTFAQNNYLLMGYKGDTEYDAGLFYCPFIPLTAVKAIDPENFQPRLGFRTRYGIGENPFGANLYYRLCNIENLDNSFGADYTYIPTV